MDLVIDMRGTVRCLYEEPIDLHCFGVPVVVRASHVEPDQEGRWWADLRPVDGPRVGPFGRRSQALAAERQWLLDHWLYPAERRQA